MNIHNKYIVVDDFCPEIDNVIASSNAAGYGRWAPEKGLVGSSIYDGMNYVGNHALMLRALVDATGSVVVPNSMFFRVTNEGFEKAYIHSDREMGAHTCVCYLSDHDEEYGTAFYKHIPTGLYEMPTFAEMQEMGIMDMMAEHMVSRNPDVWELVDVVEGKKNRAVVFHAPLFHSRFPLEGIGKTYEDGRLVWVSHFYKLHGDGSLL